ncbi:CdiA family toxin C-terminal domain-containing protein [Oceanobacillus timonensis]|uniref:CdiA family toxin C-terminal domain-containing protein n=1 Tax=Oceanobacillus timonensis TaxID=1926285 RepID=UPI001FE4CCE5|nr:CdiA family toxin C-terminal domain-containing protein [Oceanobacillus timonensis]
MSQDEWDREYLTLGNGNIVRSYTTSSGVKQYKYVDEIPEARVEEPEEEEEEGIGAYFDKAVDYAKQGAEIVWDGAEATADFLWLDDARTIANKDASIGDKIWAASSFVPIPGMQFLSKTKRGANLFTSTGSRSGRRADNGGSSNTTAELNNFKINDNAKNHLVNSEGFVRKGGKGVVGGHNIDSFYGELRKQGFNVEDCIINKKSHPSIKGVYEIEYRVPALDRAGKVIPNQYKEVRTPKTVYDPKYISNDDIYKWGIEALENGTVSGREIIGTATNGLEFKGYINNVGEITNFYPVFSK